MFFIADATIYNCTCLTWLKLATVTVTSGVVMWTPKVRLTFGQKYKAVESEHEWSTKWMFTKSWTVAPKWVFVLITWDGWCFIIKVLWRIIRHYFLWLNFTVDLVKKLFQSGCKTSGFYLFTRSSSSFVTSIISGWMTSPILAWSATLLDSRCNCPIWNESWLQIWHD